MYSGYNRYPFTSRSFVIISRRRLIIMMSRERQQSSQSHLNMAEPEATKWPRGNWIHQKQKSLKHVQTHRTVKKIHICTARTEHYRIRPHYIYGKTNQGRLSVMLLREYGISLAWNATWEFNWCIWLSRLHVCKRKTLHSDATPGRPVSHRARCRHALRETTPDEFPLL